MDFIFPRIKDLKTISNQIEKIIGEMNEFKIEIDKGNTDNATMEIVDVLHATESLLRIFMEQNCIPLCQINLFIQQVKCKNLKRGYYL